MENENNSILPVKPSDNAIVSISNQIALTNKLLSNIEKDKKELSQLIDTVTDIDGNVYHTVKIGTQCWMVENLKTSRFRDGSAITEIKDDSSWTNAGKSQKATWCYYDNNAGNHQTYGKLYNWHAVADPRNLCPAGWHVPTDKEFKILTDYLGGIDVAGGKMKTQTFNITFSLKDFMDVTNGKVTALPLWNAPNTGADNSSGFTALPAGYRGYDGAFGAIGNNGGCWSSTEDDSANAWTRYLDYGSSGIHRFGGPKGTGLSVRCIRD